MHALDMDTLEWSDRYLLTADLSTSSNHRLESAGLNALEELLFKMLGMGIEDSNACLVCKGNWIFERPLY